MRYKCQFPGCTYETDIKSQINIHHIVPKELGGSEHNYNKICLCPNCHSKIYIKDATSGIHSKFGDDSIILHRWLNSMDILEYETMDEKIGYYKI